MHSWIHSWWRIGTRCACEPYQHSRWDGTQLVLEPESSGEGHEGSLEELCVDEEFRIYEKGIGNDSRAGCPTRCRPRAPDGEKNDPGNEQFPGSPFATRESHGRKTAKRTHGSFVH